MFDTYKLIMN